MLLEAHILPKLLCGDKEELRVTRGGRGSPLGQTPVVTFLPCQVNPSEEG